MRTDLVDAEITRSVIGAFHEVYNTLDFGFLEHVYKAALEKEMRTRDLRVEREVRIVVRYKGDPIAVQIVDMVVDGKVIVEVKSTPDLNAVLCGNSITISVQPTSRWVFSSISASKPSSIASSTSTRQQLMKTSQDNGSNGSFGLNR